MFIKNGDALKTKKSQVVSILSQQPNHPCTNINIKNFLNNNFSSRKQPVVEAPAHQKIQQQRSKQQKVTKARSQKICSAQQQKKKRFNIDISGHNQKFEDYKNISKKTPKSATNKYYESKSFSKATKMTIFNSKKNSIFDRTNAQTQTQVIKMPKQKKVKLSTKSNKKSLKQEQYKHSKHTKTVSVMFQPQNKSICKRQTKSIMLFEQNKLIRNLIDNSQQTTQQWRRKDTIDQKTKLLEQINDSRFRNKHTDYYEKSIQGLNSKYKNANANIQISSYFNSIDMRVIKKIKKDFPRLSKQQIQQDIFQMQANPILYYTKVKRIPIQKLNESALKIQRFWRRVSKIKVKQKYESIFSNIISKLNMKKNINDIKPSQLHNNHYINDESSVSKIGTSKQQKFEVVDAISPGQKIITKQHGHRQASQNSQTPSQSILNIICSEDSGYVESPQWTNSEIDRIQFKNTYNNVESDSDCIGDDNSSNVQSSVYDTHIVQDSNQDMYSAHSSQRAIRLIPINMSSGSPSQNKSSASQNNIQLIQQGQQRSQSNQLSQEQNYSQQQEKQQDQEQQEKNPFSLSQPIKITGNFPNKFKQQFCQSINFSNIQQDNIGAYEDHIYGYEHLNLVQYCQKYKNFNQFTNNDSQKNIDTSKKSGKTQIEAFHQQQILKIKIIRPQHNPKHNKQVIQSNDHSIGSFLSKQANILKKKQGRLEQKNSEQYKSKVLEPEAEAERYEDSEEQSTLINKIVNNQNIRLRRKEADRYNIDQNREQLLCSNGTNKSAGNEAMGKKQNMIKQETDQTINDQNIKLQAKRHRQIINQLIVHQLLNQFSYQLQVILTVDLDSFKDNHNSKNKDENQNEINEIRQARTTTQPSISTGHIQLNTNNDTVIQQTFGNKLLINDKSSPYCQSSKAAQIQDIQISVNIRLHENEHDLQRQGQSDKVEMKNWLTNSKEPEYEYMLKYSNQRIKNLSQYQSQSYSSSYDSNSSPQNEFRYTPSQYIQQSDQYSNKDIPISKYQNLRLVQPQLESYPHPPPPSQNTKTQTRYITEVDIGQVNQQKMRVDVNNEIEQGIKKQMSSTRHKKNKIDQASVNIYMQILIQTIANNYIHQRVIYCNMQQLLPFDSFQTLKYASSSINRQFSISQSNCQQNHCCKYLNIHYQIVKSIMVNRPIPYKIHNETIQYLILMGDFKQIEQEVLSQWYRCVYDCFNQQLLEYRPVGVSTPPYPWQSTIKIPHYFEPTSLDQVLDLVRQKIQYFLSFQVGFQFEKMEINKNLKSLKQAQQKQFKEQKMVNELRLWLDEDSSNWGNSTFGTEYERLCLFITVQNIIFHSVVDQLCQQLLYIQYCKKESIAQT